MAYSHTVYVLDADRDVRRARVLRRNEERGETVSVEVPLAFFELASDLWEAPDGAERSDREMQFINTGSATRMVTKDSEKEPI